MQKAREEVGTRAAPRPAITSTTVLGAPRPQFGRPTAIQGRTFIDRRPLSTSRIGETKTVLGVPRPEFGAPESVIDIRFENEHPVYRPNDTQKDVAKEHLALRGLPTKQVDDLKFVGGLDKGADIFTRAAYHGGGEAVTQGNTVYVHPEKFINYADFGSKDPFEEIYHSADFAAEGGGGFYTPYSANIVGGVIATGDGYRGNLQETFAKGAAKEMYETYRYRQRGPGK